MAFSSSNAVFLDKSFVVTSFTIPKCNKHYPCITIVFATHNEISVDFGLRFCLSNVCEFV